MIEQTTVLAKEIAEMYEGEQKRLRRSASMLAVPPPLKQSRQECTSNTLAMNLRYTLRSTAQRETSARAPRSSLPQSPPTESNRQPTIGPPTHSHAGKDNDASGDDEEALEKAAVVPDNIKRRKVALMRREAKENRTLAELVEEYRRKDEEIEVTRNKERQAKRALAVIERKVYEVEQKEKESASRKKEISLLKKARLQQERELGKARKRVQRIYEKQGIMASSVGVESCCASS